MSVPVRLERDGALAVLTIDSPPLNLFDQPLIDGIREAIDDLAADHPRGLLIRAEGESYGKHCAVHVPRDRGVPVRGGHASCRR